MVGLLSLLRLPLWAAGKLTGEGQDSWGLRGRLHKLDRGGAPSSALERVCEFYPLSTGC